MTDWMKLIYNRPGRAAAEEWRSLTWISDGHRFSKSGVPIHRPSYKLGDEILVYCTGDGVAPARFRVIEEPVFDPDRVDRQGYRGDGKRWGWLTETELIGSVDLDGAPTLHDLGISPMSIRQQDHIRLRPDPAKRARSAIRSGVRPGTRKSSQAVPIENRHVEAYEQRFEAASMTVQREEQKLVRRYRDYLVAQGREVYRHRLPLEDVGGPLYTDLFEAERSNLVEAKARITRPAIRMAIGQLADYASLVKPTPKRLAVLVPERLSSDLERLLESQGIKVIWPSGRGFRDNASGQLT